MKTLALLLLLSIPGIAQNVITTNIPGTTHYGHTFRNIHRLGQTGEERYPRIQIFCRSNDSDLVLLELQLERKGAFAVGSNNSKLAFNCDGDIWKVTSMKYMEFPLNNGVLESFEFFAPTLLMEMLANSDTVTLNIEDTEYPYPVDIRKDYKELWNIVHNRNKMQLIQESPTGQGINLE